MRFEQRLTAWSVAGFLQQALFVGAGASAALVLVAAAVIAFGSLAIRAVLPAIDRHVEQGWVDALGPLSTLAERYPKLQKNPAARQVEVFAATLGVSLASEEDAAAPIPNPQQVAAFSKVRASLLADAGDPGRHPYDRPARDAWMSRNSSTINDLAGTVVNGDVPVWAMDLDDCVGSFAVKLDGLVDLQNAILASAQWSIDAGDLDRATTLLETSWRLNDTLQRNPRLEEHLAAITVVDHQMTVLRRHPDPGGHWKVRLAALDLERRALEAVRLDAWLLRCRAAAVLNSLHPVLGVFAQPFARLLAIQQHQAMVWAVEELPARNVTRFDPDRFVAEQHRRIPRWNTIARSGLPDDWQFWPDSVRGSLYVELALRTLELQDAIRHSDRFNPSDLAPRQPSRVPGVEWSYTFDPGTVSIALDDGAWLNDQAGQLSATVSLPSAIPPGGEP